METNLTNKFYVPDISEFHVGFECEILDRGNNTWNNIILTYEILSQVLVFPLLNKHQGFLSYIERELNENNIRVKYLDKEDIESLGFHTEDNGECYNTQNGFTLYGLYPWEWNKGTNNQYKITIDSNTVFFGIIKNKSELKVLLKQLNII